MNEKHFPRLEKNISAASMLEVELKRVDKSMRFWQTVRSTAFTLAAVAAVAVLISTLLFPVLQIYGASMAPTLHEGEIVIAVKTDDIDRGDLVAFYYGNKALVKRCIGLAGDEIDIDEAGNVFVNGNRSDEPYLEESALGEYDIALPYQVPDGRYFVMGDRRAASIDSRNTLVGCVAPEQIIGKISFRLWPLNKLGRIE